MSLVADAPTIRCTPDVSMETVREAFRSSATIGEFLSALQGASMDGQSLVSVATRPLLQEAGGHPTIALPLRPSQNSIETLRDRLLYVSAVPRSGTDSQTSDRQTSPPRVLFCPSGHMLQKCDVGRQAHVLHLRCLSSVPQPAVVLVLCRL